MTDWKPYMKDRKIRKDPNGFFVIIPNDYVSSIPLSCELCDRLFRSKDDESSYNEFKCCYMCAMQFAHPRRKEWSEGWRPTSDMIKESLLTRPPMFITIDI